MLEHDFEESVGYWAFMLSRAFEKALNEELAPLGITLRQSQVLAWLALEKELSQSDLAERLKIEPPTLVRILDRMERDGWIRRHSSLTDRRKKLIRPTRQVRPVWDKVLACIHRIRARTTRGLDPETLILVRGVLIQMQENLLAHTLVGELAS